MSGHSKWATIKRSKGKADAARGKLFNRLIREITIAARIGGGDVTANPRLSLLSAVPVRQICPTKHRGCYSQRNWPARGVSYEEITFEGYGPGGIAVLIECMTDNRNRTVSEVRHVLTKHGGNLGQTNSVSWMFKNKGLIRVAGDAMAEDQLMEVVLEAGAEDISLDGDEYEIVTTPETYEAVKEALKNQHYTASVYQKIPENTVGRRENVSKVP